MEVVLPLNLELAVDEPIRLPRRRRHVIRFHEIKPSKLTYADLELTSSGYNSTSFKSEPPGTKLFPNRRDSDSFASSEDTQSMPLDFYTSSNSSSIYEDPDSFKTPYLLMRNHRRGLLPGEISSSVSSLDDQKMDFCLQCNYLMSESLLESLENQAKFIEKVQKIKLQMFVFLSKLSTAITSEVEFLNYVNGNDVERPKNLFTKDSEDSDSTDDEDKFRFLPKLGKVHIELLEQRKTWEQVLDLWIEHKCLSTHQSLNFMKKAKREIEDCQMKILYKVQTLIEMRLKSLSCYILQFLQDNQRTDWLTLFQHASFKRVCKLIEAFNKSLKKKLPNCQKSQGCWDSFDVSSHQGSYNHTKALLISPFFSLRILQILLKPSKELLSSSLHHILTLIHKSDTSFDLSNLDWEKAHELEVDEDDVIIEVCGRELRIAFNQQVVVDSISAVRKLIDVNTIFVRSFLHCLAGNTSLLRGRMSGKTPRSTSSSQILGDDDSDDDVISIASSHLGRRDTKVAMLRLERSRPNSSGRKKVLWRDSWDEDEVLELSKTFMTSLMVQATQLLTTKLEFDEMLLQSRYVTDCGALQVQAQVANMSTFELLPTELLGHLRKSAQHIVAMKALSSWDQLMNGFQFERFPLDGGSELCANSVINTKAIYALRHILENFSSNEETTKIALSRLLATLKSSYCWMQEKSDELIESWEIKHLMQVCLTDLSHMTSSALRCLPLVEKCHNHIERKRAQIPGTLHQATLHLHQIDQVITDMQSLKGSCMRKFKDKCEGMSRKMIKSLFPPPRKWKHKKSSENWNNDYVGKICRKLLSPICQSVASMNSRAQLTAVPTILSAVLHSIIRLISSKKISFSHHAALQLRHDFDDIISFVTLPAFSLKPEVSTKIGNLAAVKRCKWLTSILVRTDQEPQDLVEEVPAAPPCVYPLQEDSDDDDAEDKWVPTEDEVLALRVIDKQEGSLKKWFRIPCSNICCR